MFSHFWFHNIFGQKCASLLSEYVNQLYSLSVWLDSQIGSNLFEQPDSAYVLDDFDATKFEHVEHALLLKPFVTTKLPITCLFAFV